MANRHRARFANYIPRMLSILFEQAIDLDWQRDNPAKGIAKIKTGDGHKPWPALASLGHCCVPQSGPRNCTADI